MINEFSVEYNKQTRISRDLDSLQKDQSEWIDVHSQFSICTKIVVLKESPIYLIQSIRQAIMKFEGAGRVKIAKYQPMTWIFNQILSWKGVVEFIIFIKSREFQLMEGLNLYQECINYQCTPLYCNNYFPVFSYCYQNPFQSLNFAYNQNSYAFYPENDKCVLKDNLQSNTETQSFKQHEKPRETHPQLEKSAIPNKASKQNISLKRIERNGSKSQVDQKQNRNVYSNILRNFFRKVNDFTKIESLVKNIILRNRLNLTVEEFKDFVIKIKVNYGKYLRFKKLRHLFIDENRKEYSIIFRTLFVHMANGELLVQALTSRKIGKWSVILHLKGARELQEKLYN